MAISKFSSIHRKVFNAVEFSKKESLIIEKDYSDFKSFYDESKSIIYHKIIDLFGELKSPREEILLTISAKIEGLIFDSDIIVNKAKSKQLINVMKPYFEELDEYETCMKILNLCKNND